MSKAPATAINEVKGGFMLPCPEAPPEEEFVRAKALLQSMHSGGTKLHDVIDSDGKLSSLYEHLVNLMKYILEYQPSHAMDQFESLSRLVKREHGMGGYQMGAGLDDDEIEARATTVEAVAPELKNAEAERTLLKHPEHIWEQPPKLGNPLLAAFEGNFEEGEDTEALPNLSDHALLIEQAGIGIAREEIMRIWLSLRILHKRLPDASALRFWGKIFATEKNYYIIEAESGGDEEPDEEFPAPWDKWKVPKPPKVPKEPPHDDFQADLLQEGQEEEIPVEKRVLLKLPKNKWKPYSMFPKEPRGRGMNRWTYYVCTELGEDNWVRLPAVKPEHISLARQHVHIFTGDLNGPIGKLPGNLGLFPGVEAHYLRAQIARIGSACTVSPAGVFEVDEEDEVEEGEKPETLMMAEEYEPLEFSEMLDLANWVHHRPYLFNQGRINWLSQKKAIALMKELKAEEEQEDEEGGADEEDEEEMQEEGEEENEEEPEEGPDLLTPLEEDVPIRPKGGLSLAKQSSPGEFLAPLWRVRPSTVLLPPNCAVAVVANNRWPGAYAMARKATFVNVYIGWGIRELATNYIPPTLPELMREFDDEAANLRETVDPTVLQEEEVRLAKEAKRLAAEAHEEGDEDEEEDED